MSDPNKLDRAVTLSSDGIMRLATDVEQAKYDADRAKNTRTLKGGAMIRQTEGAASKPEWSCAITTGTIATARIESGAPSAYRLAKKPDGTLVLQGAYMWHEGLARSGHEWRDIPTVDLTEHTTEQGGAYVAETGISTED